MNTTIDLVRPTEVHKDEIEAIAKIAGQGFEREDDIEMTADTRRHIADADIVQLYRDQGQVVAFSLYARCLWR